MEAFSMHDIQTERFFKTVNSNDFASRILLYGRAYSGSRHNINMLREDGRGSTSVQHGSCGVLWWSTNRRLRDRTFTCSRWPLLDGTLSEAKHSSWMPQRKIRLEILVLKRLPCGSTYSTWQKLTSCFTSTAVNVPMCKSACTEYHFVRTVDSDETNILLVHIHHYLMEVDEVQKPVERYCFRRNSAWILCVEKDFVW